jgi:pyruvate/2-oxoacid:ferredoxin oxidoreductase beta subunit
MKFIQFFQKYNTNNKKNLKKNIKKHKTNHKKKNWNQKTLEKEHKHNLDPKTIIWKKKNQL